MNRAKVESNGATLPHHIVSSLRATLLCVFLFWSGFAGAQDCNRILDQAKASFADGQLYEIPGLLEECLDRGFTSEQRVEAYELLSLTYLYIDQPDLAEESYLNLLRADPEWEPDTSSEVEIDFMSRKFKTTPIFTIYPVKAGVNFTYPQVIHNNGTDNTMQSQQSYKSRAGFQIGTGADWNMSDHFSLAGEVWLGLKQYRFNNKLFNSDSLVINYSHISLEVPIYLRYTHRIKLWYPYAFGGYSFSYFISSNATPDYFDIETTNSGRVINPDNGRTLNISKIRNNINHFVVAGVGTKYRIGYRYLFFEVRYAWGLKNVLNADNQFDFGPGGEQNDIRELTFRYAQVDDDFRINNLFINVGYVYPFYKPRRIEKGNGLRLFRKKGKKEKDQTEE